MDNSPLWDEALSRLTPARDDVPPYERVDVHLVNATERPSDAEYDRYAFLVGRFRDLAYDATAIRASSPFALRSVLFNSILVQANRDLAEIARVVGGDPDRFEEWAAATAAALDADLWDEELGVYRDYDVVARQPVTTWTAAGFAPLFAGVPSPARVARMVERVLGSGVEIGNDGFAVTSLPPGDPRFQPHLYWRGPVWPILNWFLHWGLRRYGYAELADRVRTAVVELARDGGFWEHYDPETGRGHGGDQFAWTAALVLDLLPDGGDEEPNAAESERRQ